MGMILKFEDIEGWQKARDLTRCVYDVSEQGRFLQDGVLKYQIRKASISSMANIAEGFERDGVSEFIHFLSISKGSVGEVESHMYVAKDRGYVDEAEFARIQEVSHSAKRLIAGFMHYLARTDHRGLKFKDRS